MGSVGRHGRGVDKEELEIGASESYLHIDTFNQTKNFRLLLGIKTLKVEHGSVS